MIWLHHRPWGRWLLTATIAITAISIEMRPDPVVDHPFATVEIEPGDPIGAGNVESERVPAGLFEEIPAGAVATRAILPGEPILVSSVNETDNGVPPGWWLIETEVPPAARVGDRAMLVMLDSGVSAQAVVVSPSTDDPLGSGLGAVAVEPELAAEAAAAAAQGRVALMIETG